VATILVADDEPAIRGLLEIVLKQAGHEVMTACNGLEAVALFRSYSKKIDLLMCDLMMPTMNGHEAIRRIRESSPKAKIICMTGYSDQEIPQGVLLLQKPFQVPAVLEAVNSLLQGSGPDQ
jgi:CheY-like chemotaxis protein